jgi:DNA invertase Pin-like site-specific DNA recombinase
MMQTKSTETRVVRCAVYCRKSTDEGLEREFNSLDAQRESCEAYVTSQKHEGWIVLPEVYSDGGFTGANTERPALQRILDDIRAGKIDAVVTYKVDRLSRSLLDFARLMELFEQHGVSFVSVTQNFATTSAIGKLTLNILMSFAEFERAIIAERVRDKIAASKRRGKFMGGTPALGYDICPTTHKLLINAGEAKTVRHIFKRFADVGSGLTIAKELNAKGVTTKSWTTKRGKCRPGKPWNASLIYRMLSNRTYRGETVHKDDCYPGEHEAIISQTQWDAVQSMICANPRKTQRTHESVPALLGGIIRCGHCDRAMTSTYTRKGGRTYRYYVCTKASKSGYDSCPVKTVAAGDMEQAVLSQVRAVFRSPEMIVQTYLEAKKLEAEEECDTTLTQWDVIDALKKFDPAWEALNPAEQRRVVGCLVESVTVTSNGLDVQFRTDGIHSLITSINDDNEKAE